jgi:hypothetical protein
MWFILLCVLAVPVSGFTASAWAESSLIPDAAPPGAVVSIAGKGFGQFRSAQDNRVLFRGTPALIQRWDPNLIVVKVPLRAANGPVEVVRGKKKTAVGTFTVQRPTIQAVTPTEVEPGSLLQIAGTNFTNTAGSKDPNTMFGVNDVLISGVPAKVRKWRNDKIEVEVPGNASSGDILVRLASSDPLPDGSCCAPVEYSTSNTISLSVIPSIRVDPPSGPVGTKVVLFGKGFGATKSAENAVEFNGRPGTIAQWTDGMIVTHVPLNATTGPLVVKLKEKERSLGNFTVVVPKATGLTPVTAPIGSLVRITGENFGFYSESGATPFAFSDFDKGDNAVEFGGVPGIIYRWHHDKIDVWVPFSAKSGPVVVKRGGNTPKPDGSCCAEKGLVMTEAGTFTLVTPKVESYSPVTAGLDDTVTITGTGFGNFLKTTEATQPGLNEKGHAYLPYELGENVSRSEVLFNNVAAIVVSWTDTEIKVQVPHRLAFGIGKAGEFNTDVSTGPLIVRRGSWDLLPDGSCCTPKRWVTAEAGTFTVQQTGLPDQRFFKDMRQEAGGSQ